MKSQNMDFDGMAGDGVNRGKNRFAGNKSGLVAKANYGRGPTKGNQDYDANQGPHREPYTRQLPSSTKIKNPDYINGGPQFRGDSTVSVKKPGVSINVGRGPTKGNQQ